MTSRGRGGGNKPRPNFRAQLNPAFAKAHGLKADEVEIQVKGPPPPRKGIGAESGGGAVVSTATASNDDSSALQPPPQLSQFSTYRLEQIIKQARSTGKLNAANAGLTNPLPDQLFDLRLPVTLSMSSSSNDGPQSYYYTEEMVTLVDLSDNSIDILEDDERFQKFVQVQKIRFRRSGFLMEMNLNMSQFEHLLVLDLSGNQLQMLDMNLLPSTLIELQLQSNKFQTLKTSTMDRGGFPNLTLLDVSDNQFTDDSGLDGCFSKSNKLVTLRCSKNKFKSMPAFLFEDDSGGGCCETLQTIDLSYNHIAAPADMTKFTKLHTINLGNNKLETVPCISSSVRHVDLNTNKLTTLGGMFPPESSESSSLENLLLHDNYLEDLGPTDQVVPKWTALQRLDISFNKLKNLPYQLGFLSKLQSFKVMGNPMFTFKSSDIDNNNTRAILQVLRNRAPKSAAATNKDDKNSGKTSLLFSSGIVRQNSLHLSKATATPLPINELVPVLVEELKGSPEVAFDITGQLILDGQKLESFPEELLPLLPNMSEVSFCDNLLAEIPQSLAENCSRLKKLTMKKNRMTNLNNLVAVLPAPVWSKSLIHLDLSINRLTGFPFKLLRQLECLEVLNLSANRLDSSTSTDTWDWLPSTLRILDLSENRLTNIDNFAIVLGACCQQHLQVLNFGCNDIRKIPYELGLLSKTAIQIKHLDLKGNPQQTIRQQILEKSCADQLDYLYNRMTKEQREKALAQMIRILKKNKAGAAANEEDDKSGDADQNDTATKVPTNRQSQKREQEDSTSPVSTNNSSMASTSTFRKQIDTGETHEESKFEDAEEPSPVVPAQTMTSSPVAPSATSASHSSNVTAAAQPTRSSPSNESLQQLNESETEEPSPPEEEENTTEILEELKKEIQTLESELEYNFSLSHAKRYAIKKSIQMARSKVIREERRLGLRK